MMVKKLSDEIGVFNRWFEFRLAFVLPDVGRLRCNAWASRFVETTEAIDTRMVSD